MEFIRGSALLGFPELVTELGGDSAALLGRLRLDHASVGDAEAFLPYRAVVRAIETAAVELDCLDFGLRLSTRQGLEILGPVALVARHAATAGDALGGFARYFAVYSPALRVAIEELDESRARFTFSILPPELTPQAQTNELALGVALGIFRMLLGPQFRPLRVALPHAARSQHDRYTGFFGCRVFADQEFCGFEFRAADLERRLGADDPVLDGLVRGYLDAALTEPGEGLPAQVRRLIARSLSAGQLSISDIAAHLGMHPRTLQRRLAADDLTFEQLTDDVRRTQAEHYLLESDLPFRQLAAMLGYAEQSCLSRSCVRWFGASPRAIRATRPVQPRR